MERSDMLTHALGVFLRYGYRKSSMDDVAQAVGVSRQWIYQQFKSKQDLFKCAVTQALDEALDSGRAGLASTGTAEDRVVRGFDGWAGAYLACLREPHAAEILEAVDSEFGEQILSCRALFESALARVLDEAGVTDPEGGATLLSAASHSVKHESESRDAYGAQMRRFARVILTTSGEGASV